MALTEADATARAEAEVRAYCGWHIAPVETTTITLDGSGSPVLLLPSLHVTDVVSVTEGELAVDPNDYEWSESGVLRRSSSSPWVTRPGPRWSSRLRGVTVTFVHGYESWPLDVLAVVERLSARAVEGSRGPAVLTQVGAVSYATGEDGLPVTSTLGSLDRAVLDRYKLPPRP